MTAEEAQEVNAVVQAIRKDYEQENERLRQRVRDLELIVANCMESASST